MKSSGGRNEEYYDDKDDNEDDDHDDDNATTTMRTVANGGGGDGETRRDATRPGLADPHILSMTGWLMAGWLAGQSVGRLGRALPTVHVPVPCSCRRVYAPSSLRLCLPCSLYAYPCASHGGLLLFLSVKNEEPRSEAFFLYWHSRPPSRQSPPPLPTPRHGIESSRHGVRMDGERETEKERKKKNEDKKNER